MGKISRRNKDFLAKHPYCCYCGGVKHATTRDHVPSTQIFKHKRRPSGLEVPACSDCNKSTGAHEQVAALMARSFPSPSSDADKQEFETLTKSVHRWNPLLLPELLGPSWRQQYDFEAARHRLPEDVGIINANGPFLNRSMQIFGAKLIFALHYVKFGSPIPPGGGAAVRWFSNYDAIQGHMPDALLNALGPSETLQQGSWSVEDQFGYAWLRAIDDDAAAYFAYFGRAFAVAGFVKHDRTRFPNIDGMIIHAPGFASSRTAVNRFL